MPSAGALFTFEGFGFPRNVIDYAVWLYCRFLLSLSMVEAMLAACGIELTYETVWCWQTKFGPAIAKPPVIATRRCRTNARFDEVVVAIS